MFFFFRCVFVNCSVFLIDLLFNPLSALYVKKYFFICHVSLPFIAKFFLCIYIFCVANNVLQDCVELSIILHTSCSDLIQSHSLNYHLQLQLVKF